jgi:hypothetical protein
MLEAVVSDQKGSRIVKPVEMNDDFFAGILSDTQLGHSVVFFDADQQWYFRDPVDDLYHPTTENKLICLLSSLLARCSAEMPKDVDLIQLFCRFRSEDRLKAVVRRGRAIMAADSTFFEAETNKRAGGVESFNDLARGFVRTAVKRQPDRCLSVSECFEHFSQYCRNNQADGEVSRQKFKQLIAEAIREEFGLGYRTDLKSEAGTWMRGWKGLAVESGTRN